jgi:hypothetical protein
MHKVKYEKPFVVVLNAGASGGIHPDYCDVGTGASANCYTGTGGAQGPNNCRAGVSPPGTGSCLAGLAASSGECSAGSTAATTPGFCANGSTA